MKEFWKIYRLEIVTIIVVILVVIAIGFAIKIGIANSDLPDWVKFILLKKTL